MGDTSTLASGVAASLAAPAIPAPGATADPAAAEQAAENFESFFLSQTFESMFQGIGSDTMFGGGESETIYRSLLIQQYSKIAAQSGGIGIADMVRSEILKAQEAK